MSWGKSVGADLPPPGSSKVHNMPGGQIELNPHYMLKRLKAIDGWRREQSFQGYWIYSETFGEQAVLWSDLNIYWFGKYIRPTTILKINWLNRINKIKHCITLIHYRHCIEKWNCKWYPAHKAYSLLTERYNYLLPQERVFGSVVYAENINNNVEFAQIFGAFNKRFNTAHRWQIEA